MIKSPRSLTAVVHVKFNYDHTEEALIGESELDLLDLILDKATDMDPQLQELMAKFADFLKKVSGGGAGP